MIFGKPKGFTANTASITAPIGGWNARDSIAEMPPTDAVTLTNLYPTPTDVTLRNGYTRLSQLTTSTGVKTISSITHVGQTATLTTASAHGLNNGARVSISGTSPADYSGIFVITVISATVFTYTTLTIPATNATVVGSYTIGITTPVNTLMNYAGVYTQKLFAAAGTSIYQVNTPTAINNFTIANDKLQYVNFSNTGGDFIVACNGTDAVTVYDGTSWFTMATTTTAATVTSIARTSPSNVATVTTSTAHGLVTNNRVTITASSESTFLGPHVITVTSPTTFTFVSSGTSTVVGATGTYTVLGIIGGTTGGTTYTVDSKNFIHVNLFKHRLYFTEKNTMKVWYMPVDSLGGSAFPLDFGGVAKNGGFIQGMATWTLDAGQGADDYAVFATNMGEVIVYNGTDPTDATTWLLKGVWQMGYIFSRRFFHKFAGDILMITQDGLVPLAAALQSSRLDPRVNITDKIYYEISKEADQYSSQFGWQVIYYAKPNMLLINIPNPAGTEQYVMHTISKAWCNFTGINTTVFELHNDDLYFGGNGFVGKFWDGYADDGQPISGACQQAYTYFDLPGQQKRFTMIRPTFLVDAGAPGVYAGINTDFQTQNNLGQVSFQSTPTTVGIWDAATWDNYNWAGNLIVYRNWQGVSGLGYAAGINLNIVSQGINVHWVSTDYVMEKGTVL
jgi:hypothetical protein